jgi:hypothetical protein
MQPPFVFLLPLCGAYVAPRPLPRVAAVAGRCRREGPQLLLDQLPPLDQLLPHAPPLAAYQQLLDTAPLATKALSSACVFGASDQLMQRFEGGPVDPRRTAKFMLYAIGSACIWSAYYGAADEVAAAFSLQGLERTVALVLAEQFLFMPLFFAGYFIPVNSLQNGGTLEGLPAEIRAKLPQLLLTNFQVWTPANLLIYNSPLELRVLASNTVDFFWGLLVSGPAAQCGASCTSGATPPGGGGAAATAAVSGVVVPTGSLAAGVTARSRRGAAALVRRARRARAGASVGTLS